MDLFKLFGDPHLNDLPPLRLSHDAVIAEDKEHASLHGRGNGHVANGQRGVEHSVGALKPCLIRVFARGLDSAAEKSKIASWTKRGISLGETNFVEC